ncbi:hypothetical protein HK105_200749 [Polyrhizophydium stewartii]|uniref:Restriction endonuclease type IV Mrr domain-containing protein n=1 Tax=Polyrhizophydium stewartii TaxID=2732419 RepID=A0ABR4NJX9_9FUNG
MRLRRVGGAGDGGVDLVGQWYLDADPPSPDEQPAVALLRTLRSNAAAPPSPHTDSAPAPVSVLVQCKAEQSAVGPGAVRDLLGTLASQYDSAATLGILVSLNGFTRQAIATAEGTATDSSVRGGAVCLATVTAAGTCTTFWVAPAASRLLGGHLRAVSAAGGRVRMSWRGTPLR